MIRRLLIHAAIGTTLGVAAVTIAGFALAIHEHLMLQRAAHGKARALHRITN